MNFFYELILLIGFFLVILPIGIGAGISFLIGLSGVQFYLLTILITLLLWCIFYISIYW